MSRTATGTWVFQLQNVGEAEARGFEVSASRSFTNWVTASASYSRLDRRNLRSPAIKLTDTPPSTASANVLVTPRRWLGLVANIDWNSSRYSSTAGQRVSGFAVADAKAMLAVRRDITIEAGVRNAFDRNYELISGFPEPGRVVTMGLRYAIVRGEQ